MFERLSRKADEALLDTLRLSESEQQPLPPQLESPQVPTPAIAPPPTYYPTLHGTLSNSTWPNTTDTSTAINTSSSHERLLSSLAPINPSTSSSAPNAPAALAINSTSMTDDIASFSTIRRPTPIGVFPSVSTSDIQSFSDASLERRSVEFLKSKRQQSDELEEARLGEEEQLVLGDSEGEGEQGTSASAFERGVKS